MKTWKNAEEVKVI